MVVGLLGPLKDGLHRLQYPRTEREESTIDGFIPPTWAANRAKISHGEADGVVEALELEVGEAPARPGAGVGDVEVVPPRRRGEAGGAVPGHEVPEGGRRRVEGPGVGDLVVRRPRHLTHAKHQESRALSVARAYWSKSKRQRAGWLPRSRTSMPTKVVESVPAGGGGGGGAATGGIVLVPTGLLIVTLLCQHRRMQHEAEVGSGVVYHLRIHQVLAYFLLSNRELC